jgi:hypothetical protein
LITAAPLALLVPLALPARALPVTCGVPGQERSPIGSLDRAALFYFDLPVAQLAEDQLRFLQTLVPGLGPCALTAGEASLGGQKGQLLTLTDPSGNTIQAFCREPEWRLCLVRSAAGTQLSPWLAGSVERRQRSPDVVDFEIRRPAPEPVLVVFSVDPLLAGLTAGRGGLPPSAGSGKTGP